LHAFLFSHVFLFAYTSRRFLSLCPLVAISATLSSIPRGYFSLSTPPLGTEVLARSECGELTLFSKELHAFLLSYVYLSAYTSRRFLTLCPLVAISATLSFSIPPGYCSLSTPPLGTEALARLLLSPVARSSRAESLLNHSTITAQSQRNRCVIIA
jgi:hypothetical protein